MSEEKTITLSQEEFKKIMLRAYRSGRQDLLNSITNIGHSDSVKNAELEYAADASYIILAAADKFSRGENERRN